jgi:hypothetical protein
LLSHACHPNDIIDEKSDDRHCTEHLIMSPTIPAPAEWVEAIGELRLPSKTDRRLQHLMDRNNEGELSQPEREELEALVELSERLSLVRAEALQLLGRGPQ